MKTAFHSLICTCTVVVWLFSSVQAHAALEGPAGTHLTRLYHSDNCTLTGLSLEDGLAYFGNNTDVRSLDMHTQTVIVEGIIGDNKGIGLVQRYSNVTYTAYGTSWSWPYPYKLGYLNAGGGYVNQIDTNGIFDSALSPQNGLFLVTNPDPDNYGTGYFGSGTCILRYDHSSTALTLVAQVGGNSGGIAFDSAGNLYYAYQADWPEPSRIIRYSAAQVQAGNLDLADAETVAAVAAGYLCCDENDYLYATVGWGNGLNKYDPESGELLAQVAMDEAAANGIGKMLWDTDGNAFVMEFNVWSLMQGEIWRMLMPYVPNDFDRDGISDTTVYDPAGGQWMVYHSETHTVTTQHFGWADAFPVTGDYDGDSRADVAVYDDANGTWYIEYSSDQSMHTVNWGWAAAAPCPADYDGDGITDVAVYGDGAWYIRESSNGMLRAVQWGWADATPVPGDYDGDGKTDVAVVGSDYTWYVLKSSDQSLWRQQWGWGSAWPVPADYDGDGKTDIAVFHDGGWYIHRSSDASLRVEAWGWAAVVPVPANHDGDGKADLSFYWPDGGAWFTVYSRNGHGVQVNLGGPGCEPVWPFGE